MRRASTITLTALALVSLAGTSAAARPAPSYSAQASSGEVGGSMLVKAKVNNGVKGASFSATADITLPSGLFLDDVALARKGSSAVASARVAIPETETAGQATIVVTIENGGQLITLAPVMGRVVEAESDEG